MSQVRMDSSFIRYTVPERCRLVLSDFRGVWREGEDGLPVFMMYIGGRWLESSSSETFTVKSPIDGEAVAHVQKAAEEEMYRAIETAKKSQKAIRELAAIERIEIFRQAAETLRQRINDFAETLVVEAGKPRDDAAGEVRATIDRMILSMEETRKIFGEYIPGDWSDDTRGKIALVIHEPVGVVGAIGPFNYPLYIPAAKLIPALLSGNSVVLKPSSSTPISQLLLAKVLEESGLPPGCLNVVTGPGRLGTILAASEDVRMISFTGSTETGREIFRAASIKQLHLELGGKGVAIVLDDADIALAAEKCVAGALKNSGQRCDAVSLILVIDKVAEEFVSNVVKEVEKWVVGDPRHHDVKLGPLINSQQVERVRQLVDDALEKGAKLLRGGRYFGCYFEPTVLDYVPRTARIIWEETFGPVVTISRVRDESEALEIASQIRYGLDSCVFTNNFYRMWKIAKQLQTGAVTINDLPRHGVGYFPFGGIKDSGIGREGIGYSIDEMTVLKTIVFNLEPAGLVKIKRRQSM
ncbi:NADP-dependent glyceraldehyde-3-phosphate dehydrogenase [archaeon HR01]|nr:NADP-dependent glyceraldehyde-3-phosphate dehydrogenase [archaeon HR01]